MTTLVSGTQDTDSFDIENLLEWSIDEPFLEVDKMPRATMKLPLQGGVAAYKYDVGSEVTLKRNGETVFPGYITQSNAYVSGIEVVEASMVHQGYHNLRRWQCDDYDFDEDGNPATSRDGVTVNPWDYFVFRDPNTDPDGYDNLYPVHGINMAEGARALAGTKFVYQHDFQDSSHLLASSLNVVAPTTKKTVAMNKPLAPQAPFEQYGSDGSGTIVVPYIEGSPQDIKLAYSLNGGDDWTSGITVKTNPGSLDYSTQTIQARAISATEWHVMVVETTGADLLFYKTTNSGSSWSETTIDSSNAVGNLFHYYSFDGTTLYAAYRNTTDSTLRYAKSTNGGTSWSTATVSGVTSEAGDFQVSIYARTANDLYYMFSKADSPQANSPHLYKSTNGGTTWGTVAQIDTTTAARHKKIVSVDASEIVAVFNTTSSAYLARSSNDGSTWSITAVSDLILATLQVVDENEYYIFGEVLSNNVGYLVKHTIDDYSTVESFSFGDEFLNAGNSAVYDGTNYHYITIDGNDPLSIIDFKFIEIPDEDTKYGVYADSDTLDPRPSLQRIREDKDGYFAVTSEFVESIPLMNGDPNIRPMGNISTVNVTIVGKVSGGSNPTISVCRDAGQLTAALRLKNNNVRTYSAVTLARTDSYNGSSLSAWTGSVDLSADGATEKGMLGYKLVLPGSADNNYTKLYYISFNAVTVSDTDLTEGTIESYSNGSDLSDPYGQALRGGAVGDEQDWLEGDFLGMRRHEAIERLRSMTVSDAAVNNSPHWDFYIDNDLAYHFVERRGSDKTREYSIDAGNLITRPKHEFWAEEIAYQTIAYGAGSGVARHRIVNKREFSAGGMYDSDRDPTTGAATEVKLSNVARVMEFIDSEEKSALALARKAFAFHKLRRVPIEKFSVEVLTEYIRFFQTGDGILIKDFETRTNDTIRVVGLTRIGGGRQLEQVRVVLGEPSLTLTGTTVKSAKNDEALTVRGPAVSTESYSASATVICDKDEPGYFSFTIDDGARVGRIFLEITSIPYTTQGTSGATTFLGDTPGSTPVLGVFRFAIDPPLNTLGAVADFDSHAYPGQYGSATKSITIRGLDITGGVRRDSVGRISTGRHGIAVKGVADGANNNAQGLTQVLMNVTFTEVSR